MKKIIVILSFIFSSNVFATEGPFGTKWGSSIQELKDLNVTCSQEKPDLANNLISCTTNSLPKDTSIKEFYYILFSNNYGMQKVSMISKSITDDITGTEGKNIYNKYKNILMSKYSVPSSEYEYTGKELYDEYDEFYQCLDYEGCGKHISFFKSKEDNFITLELKGLSRGTGYITLTYEGPQWSKHINDLDNKKNSSDNDAL